jgi:hypothetical protein
MLYMVTFTINIPQMLAYIAYMDPMGYVCSYVFSIFLLGSKAADCLSFWRQVPLDVPRRKKNRDSRTVISGVMLPAPLDICMVFICTYVIHNLYTFKLVGDFKYESSMFDY